MLLKYGCPFATTTVAESSPKTVATMVVTASIGLVINMNTIHPIKVAADVIKAGSVLEKEEDKTSISFVMVESVSPSGVVSK